MSGDLFLNHGSPSWWSFHDVNALDEVECEGMNGPIAIVVSEESPRMHHYLQLHFFLFYLCPDISCIYMLIY